MATFVAIAMSVAGLGPVDRALAALPGANGVIAYAVPDPEADLSYIEFVRPDGTRLDWGLGKFGFSIEGWGPAFSPAGRQLAYAGGGLSRTSVPPRRERGITRSGCCALDANPTWSPTGGSFAFERHLFRRRNRFVHVMHSDGTHVRRLVQGTDPSWSVDSWIVFERDVGSVVQIYAIRPTGNRLRRITRGRGNKHSPDWSPDGESITFEQGGDIFTIRRDGRRKRQLTHGPARDRTPAYSPDGTMIVFARGRRLVIMPATGGPRHSIDCDWFSCYDPAWQPVPW
jgi:Tol biopolymer transport system component